MTEQLTLYTAKICPYAHRVELALEEAGVDYTRFEIDLQNKPEWYAPQVNPASKVPAVAYGGPKVSPDDPSPDSAKIAESLVLVEFVADLSGKLRPADPVLRAKGRFLIDAFSNTFAPAFGATILRGEPVEPLLAAIEKIQGLLSPEGYALGPEFTFADVAIVPFFVRLEVLLKEDLGAYEEGTGVKAYETLQSDPKFARYRKYLADVRARDSFKKTFHEDYIREKYVARHANARAAKKAAQGSH